MGGLLKPATGRGGAGGLTPTAVHITSQTSVNGDLIQFNVGGAAATINHTLPAGVAGDRIACLVTAGHATRNLNTLLTSGTLNGATHVAGGKYTHCLSGDYVEYYCGVTGDWSVIEKTFNQHHSLQYLGTAIASNTAATYKRVSSLTVIDDIGGITTTHGATARRAGKYLLIGASRPNSGTGDGKYYNADVYKNSASIARSGITNGANTVNAWSNANRTVILAQGDDIELWFRGQNGGVGARDGDNTTYLSITEME